jgi:predicted phosphoribosyltransferase
VVAVPVGTREAVEFLRREADEVICLIAPEAFGAVGLWYEDFSQVTSPEVAAVLRGARLAGRRLTRADCVHGLPSTRRTLLSPHALRAPPA